MGYRLVQQNDQAYLGKRVAQWDLDLRPRPNHFDSRITVATPLQKAGAYLLTAKMADGNTSRSIIWLEDTAIVKKPLSGGTFYYVADANSGAPIAKANVEFFGYRQRQADMNNNNDTIEVRNFAETTDADGQIITKPEDQDDQFQWIIMATNSDGRLAYLGFTGVWSGGVSDPEYNQTKVYRDYRSAGISPRTKGAFQILGAPRPIRPGRQIGLCQSDVQCRNSKSQGGKILGKAFTADDYGGMEGEFELPADATLGVYQVFVVNYGGGSFRVEEYKKPEFEVTVDAPTEPVMLGEKSKPRFRPNITLARRSPMPR